MLPLPASPGRCRPRPEPPAESSAGGPTPAGAPPSAPADQPQSTTVYVGKIPTRMDDPLVRRLLEICGPVRSWKRVLDPNTGVPKRFGFCEFDAPEGVLRAMRSLDGYPLGDGETLLLNVNQATKASVEAYETTRDANPERDAADDADVRARVDIRARRRSLRRRRRGDDDEESNRTASLPRRTPSYPPRTPPDVLPGGGTA